MTVPPLVKWTGGKRSQAARIVATFPAFGRYYEPFLGGGAVLWHTGRPGAVAGDVYGPLVALWTLVRDHPDRVVARYRADWHALQADRPAHFYTVRARFNAAPGPFDLNFLLRTCVNGIVRFNAAGAFNNSFHLTRPGMHPDRFGEVAAAWSARLAGVELRHGDFADTVATARAGDLVYLDPPYAGSTHRYAAVVAPARLFAVLEDLSRRDVRWALSFDGRRGDRAYGEGLPEGLARRRITLSSGHSAVARVLNGPIERVEESLYLSY